MYRYTLNESFSLFNVLPLTSSRAHSFSFCGFDFASKLWAVDGDALEVAAPAALPSYAKKGDCIGCLLDLGAGTMHVRVLPKQLRPQHAWVRVVPGSDRGAPGNGGDADGAASKRDGDGDGASSDSDCALEEMATMLLALGDSRAQRLGERLRYIGGKHCETGFAALRRSWRGPQHSAPHRDRNALTLHEEDDGTARCAGAGGKGAAHRNPRRASAALSVAAPVALVWETDAARDVRSGGLSVVGYGNVLSTGSQPIESPLTRSLSWSTRVSAPFSGNSVITLVLQLPAATLLSKRTRLCIGVCAADAAKAFCGDPKGSASVCALRTLRRRSAAGQEVHRRPFGLPEGHCYAPIHIASDGSGRYDAGVSRSVLYCLNGEAWDSARGTFVAPRLDGSVAFAPGATRDVVVQLCIDAERGRVRVVPEHFTGPDITFEGLSSRGAMRLIVGAFDAGGTFRTQITTVITTFRASPSHSLTRSPNHI